MIHLEEFGEGDILHQLRERYKNDHIYTSIGSILCSVNPFKMLPIYTSSVVDQYRQGGDHLVRNQQSASRFTLTDLDPQPPHVFSIAAEA